MYIRLNKLLGDVVISQGGVVPHIDPAVSNSPSKVVAHLTMHFIAPAQQNTEGQEGRVSGSLGYFTGFCCIIYVLFCPLIILLYDFSPAGLCRLY